jgi:DNA polymerase III epsilon subunit-like protein
MVVVFCDTETTGLDPVDSGAFDIAFLVYDGGRLLAEKEFKLNPLNEEVLFHEGAFAVHGISEETIKTYPPAAEIVPKIVEFLEKFKPEERMVFAGYNCDFDYGHIGAALFRYGYAVSDYFDGRFIDVLDLVKKAKEMGVLGRTDNNRLTTVTKALGIPHEGAHGAMADIKAARRLYEAVYLKSRREGK